MKGELVVILEQFNEKVNEWLLTGSCFDGGCGMPEYRNYFDVSRYSKAGRRGMFARLLKRLESRGNDEGVLASLTYDQDLLSYGEAWQDVGRATTRFNNKIRIRYGRRGFKKPESFRIIEQQKNGYPHVHIWYPSIRCLLDQSVVASYWGRGFVSLNYKSANAQGYLLKYLVKEKWSQQALAMIWFYKVRLYAFSQGYLDDVEKRSIGQSNHLGWWKGGRAYVEYVERRKGKKPLTRTLEMLPEDFCYFTAGERSPPENFNHNP